MFFKTDLEARVHLLRSFKAFLVFQIIYIPYFI